MIHESDYRADNFHIRRDRDTLDVTLTYPPWGEGGVEGKVKYVAIDQEAVRASDGIRVCYDYERDGWSIQQPKRLSWPADDPVCDWGWTETAFVRSWAINEDEPG